MIYLSRTIISAAIFIFFVMPIFADAAPFLVDAKGVMSIQEARCVNRTQRQVVRIFNPTSFTIDCEAAGLTVNAGDNIQVTFVSVAQGNIPDAPTNVINTSDCAGAFIITWTASDGASSYNVYSADTADVPVDINNLVATTTDTRITLDAPVVSTYYVVTAVNADGESLPSEVLPIVIKIGQPVRTGWDLNTGTTATSTSTTTTSGSGVCAGWDITTAVPQ